MKPTLTPPQAYFAAVREDFGVFIRQAFETLYPGKAFDANWHIDAIVYELERHVRGDGECLIINMPPRHLKSFLISVAWPAFLLGRDPSLKIFVVSYSDELAKAIGTDFRRLVTAEWYVRVFSTMRVRKDTEREVATSMGGFRAALSAQGSITGRGADLIIVDDPCRPEDAVSDKARKAINEWYQSTLLSRRDDKRRSGMIIVMQRLHVNDLTGFVEESGPVRKLSLPAVAVVDQIIQLRFGRRHVRRAGEALQPERESVQVLRTLRRQIGEFNFQSQYQQSPKTPEGSIFKRRHFVLASDAPRVSASGEFFISIDGASSTSPRADFSVICVLYVDAGKVYIVHVARDRWDYEELKERTRATIVRYNRPRYPVYVLVEYAGTGISLYQYFNKQVDLPKQLFYVSPKDDKVTRAARVLPTIEGGISIVNEPGKNAWVEPFVNEFMNFPNGANDDQVDSLVQILNARYLQRLLNKPKVYDMA